MTALFLAAAVIIIAVYLFGGWGALVGAAPRLLGVKPFEDKAAGTADLLNWAALVDEGVVQTKDGALLPVQVDKAQGKILFTLPAPDKDGISGRFLYVTKVRDGLGSTDIRFDRGMMGRTQMLAFRRIGKKVAVIFENPRFRAEGGSPEEQNGVATSFAFVTAATLDIASTMPDGPTFTVT